MSHVTQDTVSSNDARGGGGGKRGGAGEKRKEFEWRAVGVEGRRGGTGGVAHELILRTLLQVQQVETSTHPLCARG